MRKIFNYIICSIFIIVNAVADAATYGPTTNSDTLWHIASELQPSSDISVQQVMIGLFNHNRDAFYSSNINALESDKVLNLPSLDVLSSIPRERAYMEVVKQNRQWQHVKRWHVKSKKIKNQKIIKNIESVELKPVELSPLPEPVATPAVTVTPQPEADSAMQTKIDELAEKLNAIEAKNNMMQGQVDLVVEQIATVEQNVEQLKESVSKNKPNFFGSFKMLQQYSDQLGLQPEQLLFCIFSIVIVIFIFVLISCLLPRRRRICEINNKNKEEYNPMEGRDGIVSKLNLARTYIDMGKKAEAQTMLNEILLNGNPSEQIEARELLTKISQ